MEVSLGHTKPALEVPASRGRLALPVPLPPKKARMGCRTARVKATSSPNPGSFLAGLVHWDSGVCDGVEHGALPADPAD